MEPDHLSREDCGKEISLEEGRKIQIKMLDALVAVCDQNDLRYFLSGGTLLGAIRHHGYIPWDDEIDVNMPRPDVEKLYQISGGDIGGYRLAGPDNGEYFNWCNWYRLYNDETVVENYRGGMTDEHPYYHPIFIDIFPIEGLPEGKLRCRLYWTRMRYLYRMRRISSLQDLGEARSAGAHLFHIVAAVPARIVGYNNWGKKIQKQATKFSFDGENYVGVSTVTHYLTREKVNKKEYLHSVKVDFEGKEYNAPGNYDTYLSQLYGDYMKMPPVEQQKSHHEFHMYWRTQK